MKHSASILIIGGGIIGASICYNLAASGVDDVVLLDKSKFGSGSTSAALGGFRHQFSNALSIKLSKESVRVIENFKSLTGYDPLLKKDGYLFVASTEKSMDQLEKNCTLVRAHGIPVEILGNSQLQDRFPFYRFDGIIGGTLCMEDGHASTLALLQGYISKSIELGGDLNENTEVTKIEKNGGSFLVATSSGNIEAEKVVIASGAYSGIVGNLASVAIPIRPYPRKILITSSFYTGIPNDIPLIIDVDSTLGIGREGKGILMADNEPVESSFQLVFASDYDERVMSKAITRVPVLKDASISYANCGLYEMTPDSNPIVSEIPDESGLYCCAGFAGHGFMHAPAIGKIMSEILSGSKPHLDISKFDISRFQENDVSKEDLII